MKKQNFTEIFDYILDPATINKDFCTSLRPVVDQERKKMMYFLSY